MTATIPESPVLSGRNRLARVSEALLRHQLFLLSVPPIGTIIPYAGPTAADDKAAGYATSAALDQELAQGGWLICDGRMLAGVRFPALFRVLGTLYGGSSTRFRLPDYRGVFLRGADHGRGMDPDATSRNASNGGAATGDMVGTFQSFMMPAHEHTYQKAMTGELPGGVEDAPPFGMNLDAQTTQVTGLDSSHVGGESRPVNMAVNFLIRYANRPEEVVMLDSSELSAS